MATIKEIAKKSGVSPGTVSNVLNGKRPVAEATRKKVMQVISEMNYQPDYFAQGLRQRKSNLIGIIAEEIVQFSTPPIVEGIMSLCEKQGYRIILEDLRFYSRWGVNRKEKEESFLTAQNFAFQRMMSLNVDGIVYIGAHMREIQNIPHDLKVPLVIAFGRDTDCALPNVIINDEKGGYDVTKYLISLGHRKIGIIGGLLSNEHAQRRVLGYQKALFEYSLPYNPSWVRYGGWDIEDGYREIEPLLLEQVSAVFCLNDFVAGGVYKYLNEHGLVVGRDLSVVGFDNRSMTECCCPALTTVKIPLGNIGESAAKLILECIAEEKLPTDAGTQQLSCTLVERQSVARLR